MSSLEIDSFQKSYLWKSTLLMTRGTQESAQTVRWPYKQIIFWIEHFESQTEVQLNGLKQFKMKAYFIQSSFEVFIKPLLEICCF